MSHQTEEQAINLGHDCAMSAISAQRNVLANLSPPERLNWWVGFISAAMGAGVASVGDAAMRIIKGALTERRDAPSLSTRNQRSYLRRRNPAKKMAS